MKNLLQALKSKTVWKAIILAISSIVIAILTELDLIAYIGITNMIVDIVLRAVTKVPLSAK